MLRAMLLAALRGVRRACCGLLHAPCRAGVCGVCRLYATCPRYQFPPGLCGCAAKENGGMCSPANAMLRVSVTTVRTHCRGAATSSPRKQQGQVEQLRSVGEAGPRAEESTIETECTMGNSLRRKLRRITAHSPSDVRHVAHGVGPALDADPGSRDHSP